MLENFTDLKEKGTGKFEKEKRALKNVKHLKISKEKKEWWKIGEQNISNIVILCFN